MIRFAVLLAFAFAATPGVAQKVRVDFDHERNYSCYRTYRWVELDKSPSDGAEFPNQLMQDRIIEFVEQALAARHLTRVEANPDLLVAYGMKVTEQPQFFTYTDAITPGWGWGCCGWGGGWGSSFSTTTTQVILVGSLIVNMTDARQKRLVFQGVSTASISSRAKKNATKLQKGVNEIFEKYPPQR